MLVNGFDNQGVERAADCLASGELVGMPTETVYGLGARTDVDVAVARIFAAKGRPSDHPLIVHVMDAGAAATFAADLPPVAIRLMEAFWPGPLTVIVPRADGIAEAAAGGQTSIGLRCPAHPVALALLAAAGRRGVSGIAAPSANRFGRVSPTSATHVVAEFGPDLLVLDGGDCQVGIESSIVDCSRAHPVLLRPGVLERAKIEAAAGQSLRAPDAEAPRAPGMLAAHYAPTATVRVRSAAELIQRLAGELPSGLAVYARSQLSSAAEDESRFVRRQMPMDAKAAAHELFAMLRELDDQGVREVWIERPPASPDWDGVRDRLTRAAAAD